MADTEMAEVGPELPVGADLPVGSHPLDPEPEEDLLAGTEKFRGEEGEWIKIRQWLHRRLTVVLQHTAAPTSLREVRTLSKFARNTKRAYQQFIKDNADFYAAVDSDDDWELPESCPPDIKYRLKELVYKNDKLRANLNEQRALAKICSMDYKSIETECQRLQGEVGDLTKERDELLVTVQDLTNDVDRLTGRVHGMDSELAAKRQELEDLRADRHQLSGRTLASALAKPPEFTGKGLLGKAKGGQQVED